MQGACRLNPKTQLPESTRATQEPSPVKPKTFRTYQILKWMLRLLLPSLGLLNGGAEVDVQGGDLDSQLVGLLWVRL